MTNLLQNSEQPDFGTWQPAAADDGLSLTQAIFEHPEELGKMNRAAERSQRLVDNINSHDLSVEEAYDRRIKAVREATGVELDNPERHRMTERERRQLRMEGVGPDAIPTYQRKLFDDRIAILQNAHPDKAEKLQFGDINEEAKAVAKDAEDEYEQAKRSTKLGTAASLMAQFGGGFVGSLRDPLFSGSLIAGPTSAAGKTVAARIFSAAWRQGAYNAGITALEQPAVQAWRAEIGAKSGFTPAAVNIGEAFLFGAIPGAVFRGIGEIPGALKAPLKRVLDGNPQPGDLEKAMEAANSALREIDGDIKPRSPAERAIRLGEEMDAADMATRPPPPANDIPPQLHDDLTQAALRHADDPSKPSPQAVAAVNAIEAFHGSPHDFESFDISKIGIGEGAQSYGHGLYFAENAGVAESYKGTTNPLTVFATNALERHGGNVEKAIGDLEKTARVTEEMGENARNYRKAAELLRSGVKPTGDRLYKVRIHADREHMLDWDKPLSEQPANVQAALSKVEAENRPAESPSWDLAPQLKSKREFQKAKGAEISGGSFVNAMEAAYGKVETSKILHEAGIPGIKYLDQGSRIDPAKAARDLEVLKKRGQQSYETAEQYSQRLEDAQKDFDESGGGQTRNFVIFDDKLIDITHKNDKPLHPVMAEVQQRVSEAQPQSRAEAEIAASEALEDIGNRQTNVRVREELAQPSLPEPPPPVEGVKPPPASSKDPLDKIPFSDADGNVKLKSASQLAKVDEREIKFADIIRECK